MMFLMIKMYTTPQNVHENKLHNVMKAISLMEIFHSFVWKFEVRLKNIVIKFLIPAG